MAVSPLAPTSFTISFYQSPILNPYNGGPGTSYVWTVYAPWGQLSGTDPYQTFMRLWEKAPERMQYYLQTGFVNYLPQTGFPPIDLSSPGMPLYALPASAGQPVDSEILNNSAVFGVSVRVEWKAIQSQPNPLAPTNNPNDPSYNWSFIDSEIAKAASAGKKMMLRVLVQDGHSPGFIQSLAGGLVYNNGVDGKIWVWYNSVQQSYYYAMIQACGARYANNPTLAIVSFQCASTGAGGWVIPHASSDITALLAPPYNYTSSLLIGAVEAEIATICTAFPNQLVFYTMGRNGNLDPTSGGIPSGNPDGNYCCTQICTDMYAAHPTQYVYGKGGFAAFTQPWNPPSSPASNNDFYIYQLAPSGAIRGGQENQPTYGDPTYFQNNGVQSLPNPVISSMLTICRGYSLAYFEIYEADVEGILSYPL